MKRIPGRISTKRKRWIIHNALASILSTVLVSQAITASAQCSDPNKHFRSGIWKQWILWISPGPSALAAVQRVINEMNRARAAAALPLLVFDPQEPLVVGIIEESNPRGPDGANLTNRLPNQEVFFATFAEVANGGEVVVFLTDPLRSNNELTAKGVPGADASFERQMSFELEGSQSEVRTKWEASNQRDEVTFSAEYPGSAISFRFRVPGASDYLQCNLALSLNVIYRSIPTQTFALLERNQTAGIGDLTMPGVDVSLRVTHHDSDISAMFNDRGNQLTVLFEIDRVVRFERQ
jgi:hypothetical protein